MSKLSFQEKIIAQQGHLIHLVTGHDHTGKKAYYFVFLKKDRVGAFEQAMKTDSLNLLDYGQIIESGYGDDVPPEVMQAVKDKYGLK